MNFQLILIKLYEEQCFYDTHYSFGIKNGNLKSWKSSNEKSLICSWCLLFESRGYSYYILWILIREVVKMYVSTFGCILKLANRRLWFLIHLRVRSDIWNIFSFFYGNNNNNSSSERLSWGYWVKSWNPKLVFSNLYTCNILIVKQSYTPENVFMCHSLWSSIHNLNKTSIYLYEYILDSPRSMRNLVTTYVVIFVKNRLNSLTSICGGRKKNNQFF